MTINNIEIPDAGTTTEYIADPIGGWVYVVKTIVQVAQRRADAIQAEVDAARQRAADATAEADALEANVSPAIAAVVAQANIQAVEE